MIFVTVGHQMPFDRLIRVLDAWAEREGRADLFGQIGEGEYWPSYFPAAPFLTPAQFQERMQRSDAIVSHAGTGTIIAALQLGKPILVLPRRADLGETRNDHQFATADHFERAGYILVARSEAELAAKMDDLRTFSPSAHLGDKASPELLNRIRAFITAA
ncbi:MAG: glycosyltransferase [Planctomycetota bacterium]|nr:glycosyltransferase [Planctomycetota bacterium]